MRSLTDEISPPGSILTRIKHIQGDLPPAAKRIAAYIAANPEAVLRMSITEVAEKADASEGSVVGLCRRIGASGFQELKILIAREYVKSVQFIQEDLRERDSVEEVSGKIFAAHATSLADTRKLLTAEALTKAVTILRKASRIEVYGIGSSSPIAIDLAYRLIQLGMRAIAMVDSHMQAVSAAMTGKDVATVTISHSGSTVETVLATRLAQEAGARTIGITGIGKSPLQRYCDVVLHTVANETHYRTEAMSSRVSQLAIVDTLTSCCALAEAEQSVKRLQLSARVIGEKRY